MKKYRNSLILVLALAAMAAFLFVKNNGGTLRKKENTFAVADTSLITKFFLADKKNNVVKVAKNASGSWVLNDKYEVNPSMVRTILETFNRIDIKAPVPKGTRNTVIRMMAGKSVKTEIYQKVYRINLFEKVKLFPHEKLVRTYYVGDPTMDNSGTFMLMEGSEEPYIVNIPGFRGFVATRFSAIEADWRSHSVFRFRVPEINSVSVKFNEKPLDSYLITNSNNQVFTLTSAFDQRLALRFDTTKVVNYLRTYSNLNYESILDEMAKSKFDSILAAVPTCEIVLTDKLGKSHTLKTWKKKADIGQFDLDGNQAVWDLERMYGLLDNSEYLVTLQYFSFNDILIPIQWFLKESAPTQGSR